MRASPGAPGSAVKHLPSLLSRLLQVLRHHDLALPPLHHSSSSPAGTIPSLTTPNRPWTIWFSTPRHYLSCRPNILIALARRFCREGGYTETAIDWRWLRAASVSATNQSNQPAWSCKGLEPATMALSLCLTCSRCDILFVAHLLWGGNPIAFVVAASVS